MTRRLVLSSILSAGLVLGACGGGDDSIATAEFIALADEICAEAEAESEALGEPDDVEELKAQIPDQLEIFEQMRTDLRALDTPEDPEVRDDLLTRLDLLLDDLDEFAAIAQGDDDNELFEYAAEAGERADETEEILGDHGFTECGIDDDEDEDGSDEVPGGDDDGASDFDIDDYPVQYEPSDDDIATLGGLLEPEFDGLLTADEVTCVARFILERATILELSEEVAEGLGEAAAFECLSMERLIELGEAVG